MRNKRLISFATLRSTLRNTSLLGIIFLALLIAPISVLSRDTSADLSTSIQQLTKKYGLSESKTGIKIVSLKDNKVIYEKDANKRLVVASNVKLFTTASALCLLGPDFKYTTTLYRRGAIVGGVFKGSLIIKSNGDPNISGRFHKGDTTAVFQGWAKRLRNLRARSFRGRLFLMTPPLTANMSSPPGRRTNFLTGIAPRFPAYRLMITAWISRSILTPLLTG